MTSQVVRDEAARPPAARPSRRDLALDALRGWAIISMIIGHVGPMTRLTMLTHFPVWFSASDPFFVISGIVIGMRGRALFQRGAPTTFYRSLWRRAAELWLVHVALMLLVVSVHEISGRLDVLPVSSFGGLGSSFLWIDLLRFQSADFMNILPLYVLFLGVAPLGFEAMRRGLVAVWLLFAFTLWVAALRDPGFLRLADPRIEQVFSAPAWHFAFVLGTIVGYYAGAWGRLWERTRRWALPLIGAWTSVLFVLAQLQRRALARFGFTLPRSWQWLVVKESWGPLRVVYALSLILLLYLAVRWWLPRPQNSALSRGVRRFALEPLMMMGQKSLFCFVTHLFFALIAAAFALATRPAWLQEIATALSVFLVYGLARLDVMRVARARG